MPPCRSAAIPLLCLPAQILLEYVLRPHLAQLDRQRANTPPADAGNGLWLKGDGHGHFSPIPPVESGFLAPGNVTGLGLIQTPEGRAVLVANYGDSLQTFVI